MNRFINLLLYSLLPFAGFAQDATIGNPSLCGLNIPISDENCRPDGTLYQPEVIEINVAGNPPGAVLGTDIFLSEVHFILPHTWVSDIQLTLVSPSGVSVVLVDGAGGGEDDFGSLILPGCTGDVVLSMSACTSIQDGDAPFLAESYLPAGNFFDFNDELTTANGTWLLLICDRYAGDIGTLEYFEMVFEPMTCLPVVNVELQQGGIDTVQVAWDNAQPCGTVVVEYGTPGFNPGMDSLANEGTVIYGTCSPITLTGLSPDTEYEVYVRTYCDASANFSSNSCPLLFHTDCQPPDISLLTDFDTLNTCSANCALSCPIEGIWENGMVDSTDWRVFTGMTPTPGTGPTGDYDGTGNYIYFETSGCVDAEAQLLSKCILLDKMGTDTCNLSFAYHMKGLNMGTLRLDVTNDGGSNWHTLWQKEGNQGAGWKDVFIGLGDYPDGAILQFRFVGLYGNGSSGDMALDNIAFHGSILAPSATTRFYLDNDGDGYGQTDAFLNLCSAVPPMGYAALPGDCDDDNDMVNPGMPEIPCDGLDNNCNDDIVNDDPFLPGVYNGVSDTICNGEIVLLSATPDDGNIILWYNDNTSSGGIIGFGNSFSPFVTDNDTAFPMVDTFYVGQTKNFECFSDTLVPVFVVVNPTPSIVISDIPNPCVGDVVNLGDIDFMDTHFTGAAISFYEALPFGEETLINPPIVELDFSRSFYYLATSPSGCEEEGIFSVFVKPEPQIDFMPGDSFSICVDALDTLYAQGSGTLAPYSYLWSNGSTQPNIPITGQPSEGLIETYYVTVTDGSNCVAMDSVQIETSNSIDSVRVFTTNVADCNGTDGIIQVIPLNGLAPFSYDWMGSNGLSGSGAGVLDTIKINNLPEGVYDVTIYDSSQNGCEFRLVNVIVQGPNAVIEPPVILSVSCSGGQDGEICVNVISTASYHWNTGADTPCISGVGAGVYSLTITGGDCETILSNILVDEPEAIIGVYEQTAPSCGNASDGALEVTIYGGTPPYQFLWEDGSHNPELSNVAVGNYGLTVVDFFGCEWVDTVELLGPSPLSVSELILQPISCFDENDGLVHVEGSGGTPPYSYLWNTGSTIPFIQNISTNTHLTVTVTDAKDCMATKSYDFQNPLPVFPLLLGKHDPVCEGDLTGYLDLGAEGGTPPYQFIVNGELIPGHLITNLGVGDYRVVVQDARGCLSEEEVFTLDAISSIDLILDVVNPPCTGVESGSIQVGVLGTPPFVYEWEHTAIDTDFVGNLGVGTYQLRVTDRDGCILDTTIVLDAPQVFEPTFLTIDPSCYGVDDGIISVAYSQQGTPPFLYEWSDGTTGMPRSLLMPDTYVVTITDVFGCEYISDTMTLEYPDLLSLDVVEVGNLVCKGDSSGFIEANVIGGTPPYEINWLGYNTTNASLFDLPEGSYELVVTDAHGCPIDTVFQIDAPPPLVADTAWLGMEYCRSLLEDTLVAVVSGGQPPYQYLWSNGNETPFLFGVPEDNYSYTVTDKNGCKQEIAPVKFEKERGVIQIDKFYLIDSSCFNEVNLSAVVEISNGSGNYLYHFTPTIIFQSDQSRVVVDDLLLNSSYSVSVTDLSSGCQAKSEIIPYELPAPVQVQLDSIRSVDCIGGMNGAVFVSVAGGVPGYFYFWTNEVGDTISTESVLHDQGIGVYSLDVVDTHGCTASIQDISLTNGNSSIKIDTVFVTDVKCRGESTGSIDISVSGGHGPYQFLWDYLGGTPGEDLVNVPAGEYSVEILDANDCRNDFSGFVINEPNDSLIAVGIPVPPSCYDESDGLIYGIVTGGGAPYLYQWGLNGVIIQGETNDTLGNLSSDDYVMIVSDSFGCVRNIPVFLPEPDSLVLQLNFSPPVLPEENGIISVTPMGGTAPYEYLWSTGDTTSVISQLGEGDYEIIVTDSMGCQAIEQIQLVRSDDVALGDNIEQFLYYPNPIKNVFSVELELFNSADVSLEIFDILGTKRAVKSQEKFNGGRFTFDFDGFSAGIYFLSVKLDNGRVGVFKLVKI